MQLKRATRYLAGQMNGLVYERRVKSDVDVASKKPSAVSWSDEEPWSASLAGLWAAYKQGSPCLSLRQRIIVWEPVCLFTRAIL